MIFLVSDIGGYYHCRQCRPTKRAKLNVDWRYEMGTEDRRQKTKTEDRREKTEKSWGNYTKKNITEGHCKWQKN
jgi:hypothetical protein